MGRWNPHRLGTVAAAALLSALMTGAGLHPAAADAEAGTPGTWERPGA